ncbi:MAG: SPASM domain-containing protein [Proteobacteria bacterium]|nr:SPASM domain-containing protein [Pseudomonadota bacterium]
MGTVLPAAAGPDCKRFRSPRGEHVLVVPFSQIYDLPGDSAETWDADPERAARSLAELSRARPGEVPLGEVHVPAPQSLSLNVSQACNLACGYCYAGRGSFGGRQTTPMSLATALEAVDALLRDGDAAAPFTVGFLGGEPFVNRALIHKVVAYGSQRAAERGLDVRYSVTTNGTLLEEGDLELMRSHRFAVTVSIDGDSAIHDRQRPAAHAARGSWSELVARIRPLLASPGRAQVAARATITRDGLDLRRIFAALRAVGFRDIGFAPLRRAADSAGAFTAADWPRYLGELEALAREQLARLRAGEPLSFANLAIALKQLERGAASPYPCGAGGGYFSVASDGTWYACHRAIGDPAFALGTSRGLSAEARQSFLAQRHVERQTDCVRCWARYLCSGGCHQEAPARSAASCDFIRGWLEFCLAAYAEYGADFHARHSRSVA